VDPAADAHDDTHVVLDQQHAAGEFFRDHRDHLHQLIAFRIRHACCGLIEQDEGGREHHRSGNSGATLIGVGQRARDRTGAVREPDPGEHRHRMLVRRAAGHAETQRRDLDIFGNRHVAEQSAGLEGASNAMLAEAIGFPAGGVVVRQQHAPGGWPLEPGQAVDEGRLARTVRSDQPDDLVALDLQADVRDRQQALELNDDVLGCEFRGLRLLKARRQVVQRVLHAPLRRWPVIV